MIRAAETRMGGYFIAMNRLLRLKVPLDQCIISNAFLSLELKEVEDVVAVLKRNKFGK